MPGQLDTDAVVEIASMVDQGYPPQAAASAWTDWVATVAEAAADAALAEGSWEASP